MRTNFSRNPDEIKATLDVQRAKIAALQRTRGTESSHPSTLAGDDQAPTAALKGGSEKKGGSSEPVAAFVPGAPEYPCGGLFQRHGGREGHADGGGGDEDRSLEFLARCEASILASGQPRAVPSLAVPARMQEAMLAEDLLHSFAGLQGNWITFRMEKDGAGRPVPSYRFLGEADLDPSVREMVLKMMPLSKYVAVVRRFAETRSGYSWGLVSQALAGSMRSMLLDWELMLAQVESQLRSGSTATTFTLQALWYYIQSPMAAFQLVAKIASDVSSRDWRGAAILSHLHARADEVVGDPLASKFLSRILAAATAPYFAMLEKWICHAIIDDPYGEFVITQNESLDEGPTTASADSTRVLSSSAPPTSSTYWTDKFGVRKRDGTGAPDVPSFLEGCLKEILNTGKYLDLIRTCGGALERPLGKGVRLEYDEDGKYLLRIREAYQAASAASVRVLHDHKVLHGLEALRKYFLTAQGDLFLAFMDAGDMDLKSTNIPMQQLQDVLQLSVQASSASQDPIAASLQIVYGSKSLHQLVLDLTRNARAAGAHGDAGMSAASQLKPIHSMSVSSTEKSKAPARNLAMLYYKVPWPLVVVSPDTAMAQYQAFFKHLFDLKWVERELNKTCKLYQVTRNLANFERRASRRQSLAERVERDPGADGRAGRGGGIAQDVGGSGGGGGGARGEPPRLSNPAMSNLMLAYNTCQSMMHFFREYLLYSSFELLDPLWKSLGDNLKKSANVDEMAAHHLAFLEKAMKGLFLSRKLKLPPALFKVEELALEFVKLSFSHLDVDYVALDRAAEGCGDNPSERRRFKSRRIRAVLDAALTNPQFESQLKDLSINFKTRCADFLALLVDACQDSRKGQGAARRRDRDDVDCLSSLIERLDYNGFYGARGV